MATSALTRSLLNQTKKSGLGINKAEATDYTGGYSPHSIAGHRVNKAGPELTCANQSWTAFLIYKCIPEDAASSAWIAKRHTMHKLRVVELLKSAACELYQVRRMHGHRLSAGDSPALWFIASSR
ncbi:hypothetical protein GOBAR_AA17747 [Gossypium barbadense]|uniref:Uncharacterized protein n=1 Tax=Gossypium barbadense TaxID=3634 RepID=A0A2P5XHZ1_GOSBA|nr:hypothetical protein GOBAR_AA17747 [Gossypium barbadense]